MAIKLRWFAGSMALTAAVAACSQSVIDATAAGTTSTSGSTGSGGAAGDTTSATASAGGSTAAATATATGAGGATTGTTATSGSTSTSATTATSGSTGTGMVLGACGGVDCTADQLCVHPACRTVMGEECYLDAPDGGQICPPGTVRGPQFDNDCVPASFACVSGCPPKPPFCVDLPAGCNGVASCACLSADPCLPSNSGACHDADISAGVLSCSLKP
jgi:hypothetical protein